MDINGVLRKAVVFLLRCCREITNVSVFHYDLIVMLHNCNRMKKGKMVFNVEADQG